LSILAIPGKYLLTAVAELAGQSMAQSQGQG